MFSFSVLPTTGYAFNTEFVFTCTNNEVLSNQYFFEYGYILYTLNAAN